MPDNKSFGYRAHAGHRRHPSNSPCGARTTRRSAATWNTSSRSSAAPAAARAGGWRTARTPVARDGCAVLAAARPCTPHAGRTTSRLAAALDGGRYTATMYVRSTSRPRRIGDPYAAGAAHDAAWALRPCARRAGELPLLRLPRPTRCARAASSASAWDACAAFNPHVHHADGRRGGIGGAGVIALTTAPGTSAPGSTTAATSRCTAPGQSARVAYLLTSRASIGAAATTGHPHHRRPVRAACRRARARRRHQRPARAKLAGHRRQRDGPGRHCSAGRCRQRQ